MYFLKRNDYPLVKQKYLWSTNKKDPFLTSSLLTLKVIVAIKVKASPFLKSTLNKLLNGDCTK